MLRAIAFLRCKFYLELGNLLVYFSNIEMISNLTYKLYNFCISRSIEIDDAYDLDVWTKY